MPIPGTTKLHRLEENIGGASITLNNDDLTNMNVALNSLNIKGERYPASMANRVGK